MVPGLGSKSSKADKVVVEHMNRHQLRSDLGEGKFDPEDWIRSPDNGVLTYKSNLLIHLKPSHSGKLYYFHYGRTHLASFDADFINPNDIDVHMSEKEEQELLTKLQNAREKTVYEASIKTPHGARVVRVDSDTTTESLGTILRQIMEPPENINEQETHSRT